MRDQLTILNAAIGDTREWPMPFGGALLGVYSDSPVDIDVVTTDEDIAHMVEGVIWEPFGGFNPVNVTALHFTPTTEPARIVIRWCLYE